MEEHEQENQFSESATFDASSSSVVAPTVGRWNRAKFLFRAIEVRLRFIAMFTGIGLLMMYWRTLENYWDRWTRPDRQSAVAEVGTEFYCPMHPNVVRPGLEPNGAVPSCPICGMPLSKRNKGEAPALPAGVTARVQLTPERIKLAGVETIAATYMPLTKEIRTVGYVEHDDRRLAKIVTRVSGYVERLNVDQLFATVTTGEPLAEIYSPELYSGIQELLLAQKHGATELVASARRRLKLLGINDVEIDDVLKNGNSRARLLIRAPRSGHVVRKNVVEGSSIQAGDTLFEIGDISTVWIEADVYERDLSFVRNGQSATATVEAYPGKEFTGVVELVYPELNVETRTNRIRISLQNPEYLLRPGMFATVLISSVVSETEPFRTVLASHQAPQGGLSDEELIVLQHVCPVTGSKLGSMGTPVKVSVGDQTIFLCCKSCEKRLRENSDEYLARLAPPPVGEVLSIPEQAVIDTGRSQVVYVEREPGLFEGVNVELGPRSGGYYPVLAGVSPGDRVATAGSFLLDAETRLNPGAAATYFGANGGQSTSGSSSVEAPTNSTTEAPLDKSTDRKTTHTESFATLAPEDKELAIAQGVCPVTGEPLGSMGVPVKIMVNGTPVFLCCASCKREALKHPEQTLQSLKQSQCSNAAGVERRANSLGPTHKH